MTGRRILLIALLWVATVAGASALTWGVISSAGEGVGQPSRVTVTATESPGTVPTVSSRTWSGTGGRVTAICMGDSVSLGSAFPDVGYTVKQYENGPDRLRIDFESKDADDYAEVKVFASCMDGHPVFRHE